MEFESADVSEAIMLSFWSGGFVGKIMVLDQHSLSFFLFLPFFLPKLQSSNNQKGKIIIVAHVKVWLTESNKKGLQTLFIVFTIDT